MIKNIVMITLFISCVSHCSYNNRKILSKTEYTLKKREEATDVIFDYHQFKVTLHALMVYENQDKKSRKKYIDSSDLYEKLASTLDFEKNHFGIFIKPHSNYDPIKIPHNAYILLEMIQNNYKMPWIETNRKKTALKKITCCFCNKNN